MTTMTTAKLTATAAKHVVKAIREGLGVSMGDANSVLRLMWHMTCVEEGEDLRGIEARVRPGTPLGTRDACFDLVLDGNWKGAYRTGHVVTKRLGFVDEAMEEAKIFSVRNLLTPGGVPKIDYRKQRDERDAAGRSGEVTGTVWACEPHPAARNCARVDLLSDSGETFVMAVVPIMGNNVAQNLEFAREKVGQRLRISWVRAPEFGSDYEIGGLTTELLGDEMVVDFFLEARFARAEDVADASHLIEMAAVRTRKAA